MIFAKYKMKLLLLYFFLSFFLNVALSQEQIDIDDLFEMSIEELKEVKIISVSKYKQSVNKAPANVIVIHKNQILNRGYNDLSDVLRDLPGIDIVDFAARFGENYTIRGIEGNDRFLVLVDGHKINPSTGTFLSIGNSISVKFAQRIEVIFGPASAMYGADAFAGIINIISDEITSEQKITFHADYGGMNVKDLIFTLNSKISNDIHFMAHARVFKSDGPDFTNRDTVFNIINSYEKPQTKRFEQPISDHNIFIKTKFKNISLSYFRQRFEEGNAFGLDPLYYIYNKENKWKMTTDILYGNYIKNIEKIGELNLDISYKTNALDPDSKFYKWAIPGVVDSSYKQYMTGRDRNVKTMLTFQKKISDKLLSVYGIEYENLKSIPSYANDEVLGFPAKYEGSNKKEIDKKLTITENRYAAFGQLTYSPTEKIDFILGGRYDYFSRNKGTYNPRTGIITHPFKSTTIKFLWGTAFQAPSLFHQYEQFGTPLLVMLSANEISETQPDWKLQNQKLNTFEINIEQQTDKNLWFGVSIYHNILTNLIERVEYADSAWNKYFNKYTPALRNENVGKQKITGLILKTNFKINGNLNSFASYSYTNAKEEIGNTYIDINRVAKHKIIIGGRFKILNYLNCSPKFKWVGEINNRNVNVFSDRKQPGYTTFDLFISAKVYNDKLYVYSHLYNLFNHKIEHGGLLNQSGIYLPTVPQPKFWGKVGFYLKL